MSFQLYLPPIGFQPVAKPHVVPTPPVGTTLTLISYIQAHLLPPSKDHPINIWVVLKKPQNLASEVFTNNGFRRIPRINLYYYLFIYP